MTVRARRPELSLDLRKLTFHSPRSQTMSQSTKTRQLLYSLWDVRIETRKLCGR